MRLAGVEFKFIGVVPSSLVIGSVHMDHSFERQNHEVHRKLGHHKTVHLAILEEFRQRRPLASVVWTAIISVDHVATKLFVSICQKGGMM